MNMVIRRAVTEDEVTVVALLTRAGVRVEGVRENLGRFLVIEQEEAGGREIVGTIGFEVLAGHYGILRSLVLTPSTLSAKLAADSLQLCMAYAEAEGVDELYLLTQSTAPDLFIHMGFSTTTFDALPEPVAASPHFRNNRTEQAIPMVKKAVSTSYPHPPVDCVEN